MKKRRIIIIVASIAVVVSLFAGLSVAFSQIWNAIYDIKEELQTKATRYVIEGTFNVTQDGDLIRLYQIGTHTDSLEPNWMPGPSGNVAIPIAFYHWKRIDVPQLTLANMPSVKVYGYTYFNSAITMWNDADANFGGFTEKIGEVLYDEGCVYLLYKMTNNYGGDIHYCTTGYYRIEVLK